MDREYERPEDKTQKLIVNGVRDFILIILSYFFGYMNWSLGWFLVPGIAIAFRYYIKQDYLRKRLFALASTITSEKENILANFQDLPAWVHFPDIEKAEWLNLILKQVWPNVNQYAIDLIRGPIETTLAQTLNNYKLKGFRFGWISLGNVPLRIGGVKVYDSVERNEIVMDLDILYAGDCDIKFSLIGMNGGIKNFHLSGKMRVIMKPIISTIPIVGGLQAFFLEDPKIDFDLNGIAQFLETPGINAILHKAVAGTVSSMIVLPNKYPIQLSSAVDTEAIKTTKPKGVLRVHVFEAADLMKKDISILRNSSSDPYVRLSVGAHEYKTKTIDNNINPKWDEWCEFIVIDPETQYLNVHLWDEDSTNDESLGRVSLPISEIINSSRKDRIIPLEEAKHGSIHLRFTWHELTNDYSQLEDALQQIHELQVSTVHSAVLTVFVDSAQNLPQIKSSKPDPYVEVKVGNVVKETIRITKELNPVWENSFIFFVSNPETASITFRVLDGKKKDGKLFGETTYQLNGLKSENNLEVRKKPFIITHSDDDTTLTCSLQLHILKKIDAEDDDEDDDVVRRQTSVHENASVSRNQSMRESKNIPEKVRRPSEYSNGSKDSKNLINDASDEDSSLVLPIQRNSLGGGSLGRIYMTLRYSPQRQQLVIVVHHLENITCKEGSNIYVKTYLLPETKDSKRKTKMRTSPHLTFDENLEYKIPEQDLYRRKLKTIVTIDKIMRNDVVGEVLIDLAEFDPINPRSEYFSLTPES